MLRERYPQSWSFHRATSFAGIVAPPLDPVEPSEAPFKEYPGVPLLRLPRPRLPARPLADCVAKRASCRAFALEPLKLAELALLLHAAYGVLDSFRSTQEELMERPVPSPGGLYPLELYVLSERVARLPRGIFHYAPLHHGLERLGKLARPIPPAWFLGQPFLRDVAAFVVLTARVARVLPKYGDRGLRSIYLEAGHVGQNMMLTAAARGVGALPLAGFHDEALASALALDTELELPVYAMALGVPRTRDRFAVRGLNGLAPRVRP